MCNLGQFLVNVFGFRLAMEPRGRRSRPLQSSRYAVTILQRSDVFTSAHFFRGVGACVRLLLGVAKPAMRDATRGNHGGFFLEDFSDLAITTSNTKVSQKKRSDWLLPDKKCVGDKP